jgi:hypothetical protein
MALPAKVFNRKDGSGKVVRIRHEFALQLGIAVCEKYAKVPTSVPNFHA